MEARRGWKNMGVVETIYEDENEHSSTTPSLSPTLSSPPATPAPLHSRVEAWSRAMGRETDVVIHVRGSCFHLHKDPLTPRSDYLKRQLTEASEITLSPPLNITAETFTLVAELCYGIDVVVTPFNVAALRTAAELLEMAAKAGADEVGLIQVTEAYFSRAVAANRDYASIVMRSCWPLLPEAETKGSLVSRCIESLSLMVHGDGVVSCLDGVKTVCPEDFHVIAEAIYRRSSGSHDLLYRIVDLYLKECSGEITEDQKTRICNFIDCTNLSPHLLMHAVQNPRLPLRFIVQAMFIEQLNTRRAVISAADRRQTRKHQPSNEAVTLGAMLQHDAARRDVAQLTAAMEDTRVRMQSLEKQLNGMREHLNGCENRALDSGRSASFRFSSENKVERDQIGSVSSASFRVIPGMGERGGGFSCSPTDESFEWNVRPAEKSSFGRRLMSGLKRALTVSKNSQSDRARGKGDGNRVKQTNEDGHGGSLEKKEDQPFK
ncbi:hypothetical protein RJ639_006835, partial [Escallonia herrerae]